MASNGTTRILVSLGPKGLLVPIRLARLGRPGESLAEEAR